jgi:hypothetical protein
MTPLSMRETCELRVDEDFSGLLFAKHEGKRIGTSVRKVELETNDPKFAEAGRLQTELRQTKGKPFFYGWHIRRYYSEAEYQAADLFHLSTSSTFEPAGEECGTKYDETAACPLCKSGAKQVSDLFLPWRRIPQRRDISETIAGEMVISRRAVELFKKHRITGALFKPIRSSPASSAESPDWFQLFAGSCEVDVVPPTRVGNGPFDEDPSGEYKCTRGDLIGLNLLSEVWISRESYNGFDIVASRQFVGCRRGLLRPGRIILISPKLRHVLTGESLKGFAIDVAHIANMVSIGTSDTPSNSSVPHKR